MQHLGIIISEADIVQLNGAALRCLRIGLRAGQLLRGQNIRHLRDYRPDLGKVVGELHTADDRRDEPHREDHDEHELIRRQRSVFQQQPADGKHCQERCGHDVHGKGEIEIALVHPVDIALGALPGGGDELLIAALRLAENLDDLNAADILHRRVVERVGRRHGAGIVLIVPHHHQHEKDHAERERDKACQRHAPIESEQIYKRCDNNNGVAAHLRDDVRERRFDAVHALDEDVLKFTRTSGLHVAQRHTGKLTKPLLADIAQDGKGRLMRLRRGERVKQHPQQPERRHDGAVHEISGQVLIPRKQLADDLCHHEKRQDLKRRANDGKHHACYISGFFLPGKGKDPAEGTFFLLHFTHLTSKSSLILGTFSSETVRSSRIPPPSRCRTLQQVRQTNS